jgi:sulfite reductase (NADPH) flavoprotein alpha-component
MASPIKSAFLQVHSIIGLAISLVLGLIGLTGAMLSFEDEIVAALNRDFAKVDVRSTPALTPDEIVARLQGQPGASKVQLLLLSSEPGATIRARFARNEAGERSSVYVDPYDGRIVAPVSGEGVFTTLRNLHRFLLLPGNGNGYGRLITGVSVIGLLVLLISGIVLRWPRRVRSIRMWLKPNLTAPGRAFHWSLHSVLGTWVLPIYLISILTGLWWSFDWYKSSATWLLSNKPPVVAKEPAKAAAGAKGGAWSGNTTDAATAPSLDRAWATFIADQGSHYANVYLQVPNGAGLVRLRSLAKDAPHDAARDDFRIDSVTGRVMSVERYADKSVGDSILQRVLQIHTGAAFGLIGRILFMIAAALMPLFTVTGLILYFSRRRLRAQSKPSRSHRRAAGLVAGE